MAIRSAVSALPAVGAAPVASRVAEVVDRLDFDWSTKKKQLYAESYVRLMDMDLTTDKMTIFEPELQQHLATLTGAKAVSEWTKPSAVSVVPAQGPTATHGRKVEYRCGGLAAALKALESLHNDPRAHVVFATDGQLSIMDRSGIQGHEHPTQYDEYSLWTLLEAVFDNVFDNRNPEASNYRSFTVPLRPDMATLRAMPSYVRFFVEFLKMKLTSIGTVTQLSKDVVKKQKHSLAMYSRIDAMTRAKVGKPIMHRHGRLYFAFDADLPQLKKGLRTWNDLGIEAYMVDKAFLAKHTMLDLDNEGMHAYFIPNDSYFVPDIIETLVEYMSASYPDRFTFHPKTRLQQIMMDANKAVAVKEVGPEGREKVTSVTNVYASLGHDKVFSAQRNNKRVYKEILATSSTGDWMQEISKEELKKRVPEGMTFDQYLDPMNMLPSADKYNLHVTPLCFEETATSYRVFYRITEGGVVSFEAEGVKNAKGQGVTERRDLINSLYKLNRAFMGTWLPLCAGSCSRKIDYTNNRKELQVARNVQFSYNASGTGVVDAAGKITLA